RHWRDAPPGVSPQCRAILGNHSAIIVLLPPRQHWRRTGRQWRGQPGRRLAMSEAQSTQTAAVESTQQEVSLLDQIITEHRIGQDDEQREQSRKQIATLVEEVLKGTVRVSKDLEATINARIADIDVLLSKQLNEIMHAPEFQKLEASWRGLHY